MSKVELKDKMKTISIKPNDENFEVDFQLNYKNKIIGNQRNKINFQKDELKDVSEAKNFLSIWWYWKYKKNRFG